MSAEHFDFAVLGGGSAGYAAARTAHELGLKTIVIDGAEELGGLCILRGCMPSKSLIESANRNLTLRHATEFGLSATVGEVDTRAILQRKRRLIREFAEYRQGQLQDGRFTLMRGLGRIEKTDDAKVSLTVALRDGGSTSVSVSYVLVATGSGIHVPALPGLAATGFWTSDTILDAAEIPPSFIVLGGGAIALEMAHFLEGIGRKVTLIQRSPQLLAGTDADVANVVQNAFVRRGMNVFCGTDLKEIARTPDGKRVTFEHLGETHHVEAAEILVALGRRPAVAALGLQSVGVSCASNGALQVAPTQQTSHPRIFAAGDVCGPLEVVHLAIQQGEVAAKNVAALLRGQAPVCSMDYRCRLFGVFTEPQVAVVGLSEADANAQGIPIRTAKYPFNEHGKSIVKNETDGFVKLIAHEATGVLLGGAAVGPEATELIHEIAVAVHLGATAAQLATAPHYHPTLSEIWTYPAEELATYSMPLLDS
ncbi:MAG: dihydrolipoyl dehydrogenase family protein [Roseimicrobium sp.]